MPDFQVVANFQPAGDQPKAIAQLVDGVRRGLRHQVLLGITGSGKSLPPEERVLVGIEQNGQIKSSLLPIGEFVDNALSAALPLRTPDDSEMAFHDQLPCRYYAWAFDPVTKRSEWRLITAFIRHRPPETLYCLRTSCGRAVTVTGDHNVWVLRDGRLQLRRTTELRIGDCVPLPMSLPAPAQPLRTVPVASAWQGQKVFAQVPAAAVAQLSLPREKQWRVIHRGEGIALNVLPQSVADRAVLEGKRHTLPVPLRLTDEWLTLLGAYIAEGHAAGRSVQFSARERSWQQRVKDALTRLGFRYGVRADGDLQVSSSLLTHCLATWCGRTAWEKRLPPFWLQLSNRQLGTLLAAYFAGDGWVEAEGVGCVTASQQLADDLLWALMRLGIWARVRYRRLRKPNGTPTSGWTVTVTGRENLERFARWVGFACAMKQQRWRALLKRNRRRAANTNVDLIPVSGEQIKRLRSLLHWSQEDLAQTMGVGQAYVSLVESNQRRPSRRVYQRLMAALEPYRLAGHPATPLIHQLHSLLACRWAKIVRIEEVKPSSPWVYDVSVADWETFLAGRGGVFVHNTFTIANVIAQLKRPTLVISHNKTLAAQLYEELHEFFPHNAVEYFVSYFDTYTPEAYIPQTDTYIEKESSVNDEIDRLRHSATQAVTERRDVIVVASVSCIYGWGSPEMYRETTLVLEKGKTYRRRDLLDKLVDMQFSRNDFNLTRGTFRFRGDVLEIQPKESEFITRVDFFDEEVDKILVINPLTGEVVADHDRIVIFPASPYLASETRIKQAIDNILRELDEQVSRFLREGKIVEAQRLKQRTMYDVEMIREVGYCTGIENYSRHLDGRQPGEPPFTLLDYFPEDFLVIIDESHQTIPQLRAMWAGEKARKDNLINYGFRLPSAYDNRPLHFEEFEQRVHQVIYMSATPGPYELDKAEQVVEQIVRPTGLVDPEVEVRPTRNQVDDLIEEIRQRVERGQRVLVTTLTKRTAEALTEYLAELDIKVNYLHSDVYTLERPVILRDLRLGKYDVVVGINLLREGLDLPEVSLVAILDADKEGFLRSETSLIQTIGRAARHVEGKVILYAENITGSMRRAIDETNRRRQIQMEYNAAHGITPQTVKKEVRDLAKIRLVAEDRADYEAAPLPADETPLEDIPHLIAALEREMKQAAARLDFERAAECRDEIIRLKKRLASS